LRKFLRNQEKIKEQAIQHSISAKRIQKLAYDTGKMTRNFSRGDPCWMVNNRRSKGGEDYWVRAEVIHVLDRDNYVVFDSERQIPLRVNISQIIPFEQQTLLPNTDQTAKVLKEFPSEGNTSTPFPVRVKPTINTPSDLSITESMPQKQLEPITPKKSRVD